MTSEDETILLKAIYTPVEGTSIEYAQGAIEKNDLLHHWIKPSVWLVLVDVPASPEEWQQRLNNAVEPKHGAFRVVLPSADEKEQVRSGTIAFQR